MRRLHPEGPDATVDYVPGTLDSSSKSIETAIKSFPCGGISGWRASHFKAMLRSEERMGLLNQDEVILQVDFKYAFGSLLREQMLKEVQTRCPILLP